MAKQNDYSSLLGWLAGGACLLWLLTRQDTAPESESAHTAPRVSDSSVPLPPATFQSDEDADRMAAEGVQAPQYPTLDPLRWHSPTGDELMEDTMPRPLQYLLADES